MQRPVTEHLTSILLAHAGLEARQASKTPSTSKTPVSSAASFYIPHLPGLSDASRLKLYAGHLPATSATTSTGSDAHLFFLLAKAKHIADRERLVIWFNGGPGCSSFDGALMEVGPLRMSQTRSGQLVESQVPWNEYANVLFVDQPAGTGYSYVNRGGAVGELAPAAEQVVTFLNNFFAVFPELSRQDLYLAGESYAGQYIPYIADAITKTTTVTAPLKGLLMGNAWIDPAIQYPAYIDFSLEQGLIKKGSEEAKRAATVMKACNSTLSTTGKGKVLVPECESLLWAVLPDPDADNRCVNSYNIKITETCDKEYPPDVSRVMPYLRQSNVIDAFHATGKSAQWVQCNDTIAQQMWSPNSRPSVELLPALIDKGIEVLLFAGELDLMCNYLGVERSIARMRWKGGTGLNTTKEAWTVNNVTVGTWQTDRGVHWVRIANASHMVPIEQPLAAHDMLLRFAHIDTLQAAGGAARVPSRIGNQTAAVLGLVSPDGKTLGASKELSGFPGQIDEELLPADDDDEGLYDDMTDATEQDREAFYGPRRSAVLVLLLAVLIVTLVLALRWRSKRRKRKAGKDPEQATNQEDEEMQQLVEGKGTGDVALNGGDQSR